MKDKMNNNKGRNNNTPRNNPRNNNTRTFVEHINDVIRRGSTIPQAISGELRITNGDVEGAVAVYCSNAAYRDKLFKEAELETSKEATQQEFKGCGCVNGKSEECKDCDGCNLPTDSTSEFETEEYHVTSNEVIEALKDNEDILVNVLIALQHLKKFETLEFDNLGVRKNGKPCTNSSIEYVLANYFGVDKDDAKSIACEISDCVSLDVFKVIAKNKRVYIIAGDAESGIKVYDSNSGEKSQVFIATVLVRR